MNVYGENLSLRDAVSRLFFRSVSRAYAGLHTYCLWLTMFDFVLVGLVVGLVSFLPENCSS